MRRTAPSAYETVSKLGRALLGVLMLPVVLPLLIVLRFLELWLSRAPQGIDRQAPEPDVEPVAAKRRRRRSAVSAHDGRRRGVALVPRSVWFAAFVVPGVVVVSTSIAQTIGLPTRFRGG